MVINAEIANVGKPNLCDWPRLWSASSLIGHVFKIRKEWIIDDVDNDEEWKWIEGNGEPGNVTGSCTGTKRWAAAQTFASQPEIFQKNFLQIYKICVFAKQDLHFCKTRFAFVQS